MLDRVLPVLLLLGLLIVAGCGGRGPEPPIHNTYEGTQGVEAQFIHGTPPPTIYYFEGAADRDNSFVVEVDVRNVGASFARGGIFLSGYDPNMILFEEIPVDPDGRYSACALDIGNIATGNFGAIFRCDGVEIGTNRQGGVDIQLDDLAATWDDLFGTKIQEEKLFENTKVSVDARYLTDGEYEIQFSAGAIDFEYAGRGRLFLALFSGIDFARNYGREFFLAGDTAAFPGGEMELFTYHGRVVDWPPGLDEIRQNLLLTSCYLYTTYATPLVCIDPDPYGYGEKVCSPRTHTWGSGHGAPVTITSLYQESTPVKLRFDMEIRNVGTGQVYDPGYIEYCSPYYPGRVERRFLDVVYLGDVRIGQASLFEGDARLECTPEYKIRLTDGVGHVTCTLDISRLQSFRSAFETPLVVELWYGYSQTERRQVLLKRVR